MAMGDNIIANYIQSPKTLESFYQLPNSITRHNTFYKSAEKILFNNITFYSILIAEHSKQSV